LPRRARNHKPLTEEAIAEYVAKCLHVYDGQDVEPVKRQGQAAGEEDSDEAFAIQLPKPPASSSQSPAPDNWRSRLTRLFLWIMGQIKRAYRQVLNDHHPPVNRSDAQ
jgi:hypothetical protein